MSFYLVLIETSGNQQYIFSTNKLRENVGASELTYRAGTQWVLEAVAKETERLLLWTDNSKTLRENLCDIAKNPPIENPGTVVEVITATSGKALLLVKDLNVGRRIISYVTCKALKEAPGLDVCGVISDPFEWTGKLLGDANREVHEKFEEVRANRPGPALRFLRLPIVDECQTSGMPAWSLHKERPDGKPAPRSQVSALKWLAKESLADVRLKALLERAPNPAAFGADFAKNVNWLETHCEWLAVVHADGNGLGEVFLKFAKYAGCEDAAQNRNYVNKFREFSIALDICTEKAFLFAAEQMVIHRNGSSFTFPILPIVLGGDDLTVVCDGKDALQFTYDFLTQFEKQTGQPHDLVGDIIPQIAGKAFTPKRLSASAGVAIIKPHFPFSSAYDLAEELIVSAKRVKKLVEDPNPNKLPWPCSTLDFHALYDASGSELDTIRKKLSLRSMRTSSETNQEEPVETRNYGRPYVVTPKDNLIGADGANWAQQHHWDELAERVKLVLAKETDEAGRETDRRKLPNTQLHDLRAGLPLGRDVADARFNLIKQRYELKIFTGDQPDSLYCHELLDNAKDKGQDGKEIEIKTEFAGLLDAMDAADFWRKPDAE